MVPLDFLTAESASALEVHITAVPSSPRGAAAQAEELFEGIADLLRTTGTRIFQERVFSTQNAVDTLAPIRARAYGDLADEVAPAWLVAPPGRIGEVAGVQVHAVRSAEPAELLRLDGRALGRVLRVDGLTHITLSGITAPEAGTVQSQSQAMFEKTDALLKQAGADFLSVTRTWMWLGDILAWYNDFNRIRTAYYTEKGLICGAHGIRLPASTGIGVKPAGRAECGLDLTALIGAQEMVQHHLARGNQDSPFKYGSAFSRASRVPGPAGDVVYVSGTAAIDAEGITTHIDDSAGQIRDTVENVRAVLTDMDCTDADVVEGMAYCRCADDEAAWYELRNSVPWPLVTMIGPVCRHNLLFEIEVMAVPGARRGQ